MKSVARRLKMTVRPEVSQRRLAATVSRGQEVGTDRRSGRKDSVTIVVPCFGHGRFLPQLVNSLAMQSRPPEAVIFVNDCSPDGTGAALVDAVKRLRDLTDVLVLTNGSNLGQCASINRAVEVARTDLLMIANDDDLLMRDTIQVSTDLHKHYPEVALIGATSVHFSGTEAIDGDALWMGTYADTKDVRLTIHTPSDARRYRAASDLNMTHSGTTFTKSAWEHVGGYEPDASRRVVRFSDRDFQMRVNALYPVGVSEKVPFSLWRSDSSVDAGRNS